jgi:hypothetical protein
VGDVAQRHTNGKGDSRYRKGVADMVLSVEPEDNPGSSRVGDQGERRAPLGVEDDVLRPHSCLG